MEVNNPMMDQLLVNTAAQAPANTNTAKPKESDGRDFDSMVNQRRSEGKSEAKEAKQPGKSEKAEKAANTQDGTEVKTETDQLAVAAAMLLRPQPELHIEPMTEEAVVIRTEAVNVEIPQEAVQEEAAAAQLIPGQSEAKEQSEVSELAPETEVKSEPQSTVEVSVRVDTTEPEPEPERKSEAAEDKAPEQNAETAQTVRDDEPRAERAAEQPRAVRSAERVRTVESDSEEPEDTQSVQTVPQFREVSEPAAKTVEAPRPVPLEAEDGIEQLGRELDGIIVNNADADRVEITLTPENLGKLTVEIMRGENGRLEIVLHPSTERAANILEKNTAGLQNALRPANQNETETQQVRPNEEAQQQFLDPNGQNDRNGKRQQQHSNSSRRDSHGAQDFLQQLRLGLVDTDDR